MTKGVEAHPTIRRASMVPRPWAGHPLARPLRRLTGNSAPSYLRASHDHRPVMLRRVALLILVVISAIAGTNTMVDVLPLHGGSWAEQGLLMLFAVLFAWISAGFWTGIMGAWVLFRGRDANAVTNSLRGLQSDIPADARTALIMPICNEHVPTVFGGLRATYESLARTGSIDRFDLFVLSDTNRPDIRAAEQAAWGELVQALEGEGKPVRLHYRWRQHRSRRKAGNVADFCRRWGLNYRYMVVLDADSVMTGVLAYLSAPLWLAFLLVSSLLFARQANEVPRYFIEPYQLFPIWPTANVGLMLTLFGFTIALLVVPKLLSLCAIVLRGQARAYGGALRLMTGALLEFVHSMLLAPVRMLFHSQFVLAALTGLKLDWKSPPRDDATTGWGEAMRRHGAHSMLALGWIVAILTSGAPFPWWLSPVLGGMLLAIPISVWSSRAAPGRWLRKRGIFLIPEEAEVPPVLTEAHRYAEGFDKSPEFADAVLDAQVHHRVAAANPIRPGVAGAKALARAALVERAAAEGPAALSDGERQRLLGDARALAALRASVMARRAHPNWWMRNGADAEVLGLRPGPPLAGAAATVGS